MTETADGIEVVQVLVGVIGTYYHARAARRAEQSVIDIDGDPRNGMYRMVARRDRALHRALGLVMACLTLTGVAMLWYASEPGAAVRTARALFTGATVILAGCAVRLERARVALLAYDRRRDKRASDGP